MDLHPNSINNIASNYCHDYIRDEGVHLEKLKELVKKYYPAKFNIYAYICDVVGRVEMHKKNFFVNLEVEEYHDLEESLAKTFFMNTILAWRESKKKEHGYKMSNLFKILKI